MKHALAEDEMRLRAALYALGTLTRDEARAFEEHIAEGCAECEAELRASESIAERLAFGAAGEDPPAHLAESLSSLLAAEAAPSRKAALSQFVSLRANEGEWIQPCEGMLVKQLFVDEAKGTVTSLYKLLPGTQAASHRHSGVEECLVLEGDFHVNGEVFGPGDYRSCMPGTIDESPFTIGGTLLLIVESVVAAQALEI